jgi:hypothetical protein
VRDVQVFKTAKATVAREPLNEYSLLVKCHVLGGEKRIRRGFLLISLESGPLFTVHNYSEPVDDTPFAMQVLDYALAALRAEVRQKNAEAQAKSRPPERPPPPLEENLSQVFVARDLPEGWRAIRLPSDDPYTPNGLAWLDEAQGRVWRQYDSYDEPPRPWWWTEEFPGEARFTPPWD